MVAPNPKSAKGIWDSNDADDIDAQAVSELDSEDFWESTSIMRDVRQFARSRRIGPYALLGNALTLATSAIPPHVVLPPERGSFASLNLFVGLVGPSGATKSASTAAARDWLTVDPMVDASKPGSGEGLAKCFAYVRNKPAPPTQIGKAWSVIAFIPEVETLLATGGRNGSTMMSEFRSGWSGERLGHDFSDATKVVVLRDHRYRLCYVIGIQPMLAKALFDGAEVGTPQRILWLPVADPSSPKVRPDEPKAKHKLSAWPELRELKNSKIKFTPPDPEVARLAQLNVRADPNSFESLQIPELARRAIDDEAYAALRRGLTDDTENGHRILSQLKTAASLMFLHKRTREITELDWQLAGHLLDVSDRLRKDTRNLIATNVSQRRHSVAVSQGIMADVTETTKEEQAVIRVREKIIVHLKAAPMDMRRNELRKKFASRDRPYLDAAIEALADDGVVEVYPATNKGPDGLMIGMIDRD